VEANRNLPLREVERMMKTQDVILKAMAKKISWLSAAEIIGVTPRTMRRWRERLQEHGYDGLRDRRRGKPSQNIAEFNRKFTVNAAQSGTAFRKCGRRDLDLVFSVQTERVVAKDNTVAIGNRWWQIEKCRWKRTLAGQTVTILQHLDGGVSIYWGATSRGSLPGRPWK
jgi:transposase